MTGPGAGRPARDRFALIGWAYGLPDAAVALCALRAAGIPVHSSVGHLAAVGSHWMVALGGIDLRVPLPFAAAALAILADGDALTPRRRRPIPRLVLALLFAVSSVPPPAAGLFLRGRPVSAPGSSPSGPGAGTIRCA